MFAYFRKHKVTIREELLSGLTVSLALVPQSVAFALVAGVLPLVGLYTTCVLGILAAIIGGRPGMISGSAGALAVVAVAVVINHGVEYLFATVILMGIIQVVLGILKFGKFMRLVPHPVMLGFVNGLAIVIFLAQLDRFKLPDATGQMQWLTGSALWIMLGFTGLSMMIIHFLPKYFKAIPSSLAAILVVTLIIKLFGIDTPTIADIGSIKGGLPQFHIPSIPLSWETFKIVFPYAAILASIGLIEALMTMQLIDEITETRGRGNRECIGQGVGNFVTGLFGGMGGCAMIGPTIININSGGLGRLSSISAAFFLFLYIIVGSFLIEMIPIAALQGVMFMMVLCTFEWSSIRLLGKIPLSDAFVLILVSVLTVLTDLATAVGCGVVVSALVFAWNKSKSIRFETKIDRNGVKIYQITGALFFGSTKSFNKIFDRANDPQVIIIDFKKSRICDHSAIEAISSIIKKYESHGMQVKLRNLSPDCKYAVERAEIVSKKK